MCRYTQQGLILREKKGTSKHESSFCHNLISCEIIHLITILFPPRIKIVTARELRHSSITNILSFVVPKLSSFTRPALPSFSAVSSENLGTILPPVAIAMS